MGMRSAVLRNRGVDLYGLWPLTVWLFLAGIGTFRATRWGGLLLSLPPLLYVIWWGIEAILSSAYVSLVLAAVFLVVVLFPAYVTVRNWSVLVSWW
jgi:hypothetical protein